MQVPFEVFLARQSSHFPTWASASGTSGSRCIFHTLLRRRSWSRVRLCRFCTFIDIVTETAVVSFGALTVGLSLPTISWTSLFTLFYPWFLTTALVSKFPFLASKFFILKFCSILLFTIVFNLWLSLSSICDCEVQSSSDESRNCTIPIRSWAFQTLVFLICSRFPRCHQRGFVSSIT